MNVQEALTLVRALCTTDEHFEAFGVIEANVANGFLEEEAPMVDPALAAEDVPAEDAPAEDAPAEEVAPVEEAAPTEEAAPAEEETPAA